MVGLSGIDWGGPWGGCKPQWCPADDRTHRERNALACENEFGKRPSVLSGAAPTRCTAENSVALMLSPPATGAYHTKHKPEHTSPRKSQQGGENRLKTTTLTRHTHLGTNNAQGVTREQRCPDHAAHHAFRPS